MDEISDLVKKPKKKKAGILQDIEFDAISVIRVPSGDIAAFNYAILKMKIKNGEIIKTELTEPNMKQIVISEAKIVFMKTFFFEEIVAAMNADV